MKINKMMHKRNNNIVDKNFGKKKCLKFGLKSFQISARRGSRVLELRQRILLRYKSSSYNELEVSVQRMTPEVNAWDDDE